MHIFLSFFRPVVLLICLVVSGLITAQNISQKDAARDVQALERIFFKGHPAPANYHTESEIRARLTEILAFEEDSIPLKKWEIELRETLQLVGCGHTYLNMPPTKKGQTSPKRYALPFRVFSDSTHAWALMGSDSAQTEILPPGTEILALNNTDIATVLKRIHHHQPADGYNTTFGVRIANKSLLFNYLYLKYFNADSVQTVVWKKENGDTISQSIAGILPKNLYENDNHRDSAVQILYQTAKGRQHFYYDPENPDIGVLNIRSFSGGRASRMYKKVVKSLNKQQTPYLVIDVRDNTGGSFGSSINLVRHFAVKPIKMTASRKLFRTWRYQSPLQPIRRLGMFMLWDVFNPGRRYIKKGRIIYPLKFKPYRKKYHYSGQVFLLTNGMSFSASSQTATYLKATSNAILVGEETGGGAYANNGMQIPVYRLPGSGYRLHVPQVHLDYRLGTDNGRGVIPAIPTHWTATEISQGRDMDWEAVRAWIATHQKR